MGSITGLLSGWLFAMGSVTLWAAWKSRAQGARFARGRPLVDTRVCLVRPCAGDEPNLRAALVSTADASPSLRLRVRVAVADETDAAHDVAADAVAALVARGLDAKLVITRATGPNAKADQLATVLAAEPCDVVVVADSDVDLADGVVDRLVARLADPRVAAVWAPPIEVAPSTLPDRASASVLDSSLHAFALLGALDPAGMVGKLVALRTSELDAVGGFAALRDCLGEDVELSRRLRARGLTVVMADCPARSGARSRSFRTVVERYARWISVVRTQRRRLLASYPFVIAPLPAFLGLAAVALLRDVMRGGLRETQDGRACWLLGAAAVFVRVLVAILARVRSGSRRPWRGLLVDVVLADALLWLAFARALTSKRVRWRGVALRVARGGALAREALR